MLFLKLAGFATSVLFVCLTLACTQGTESAPDVGATVDSAVAATVEARSPDLPSALAQTVDASQAATLASAATTSEAQSTVPSPSPTQTIDASLAATLASAAATFEAQSAVPPSEPARKNVGPAIPAPMPTTGAAPTQELIPTPTLTPVPIATPTSFDIKMANCHQEDTDGYEFVSSEGAYSNEQRGVEEWYGTTWSGDYPKADRIRCLTSVYDSIEDARWSLIYSTALQRGEWSQAGLLEHCQITGVNIGCHSPRSLDQ